MKLAVIPEAPASMGQRKEERASHEQTPIQGPPASSGCVRVPPATQGQAPALEKQQGPDGEVWVSPAWRGADAGV